MASLAARMVSGALSAIVCASSRTAASSASRRPAASRARASRLRRVEQPSGEQQLLGARRADRRRVARSSRLTDNCRACGRSGRRTGPRMSRRGDRRRARSGSRRRPPRRAPARWLALPPARAARRRCSIRRSYAIPSSLVANDVNWPMSVPATNASPAAAQHDTRIRSSARPGRRHRRARRTWARSSRSLPPAIERQECDAAFRRELHLGNRHEEPHRETTMSTGRTALEGIRVLDVTQVMAGPFCAMQLCDMGAEVIKVEPPGGDSTRRMAGASGVESAGFNAVNRGKRGIVLDFGTPRGQEVMRRLLANTDILDRELPPGRDAPLRPRLRHAGTGSSGADLCLDLGLRTDRAGCPERRLRSHRSGRVRAHVDYRRSRPASGQDWRPVDRSRRRAVRPDGDPGGPPLPRSNRPGQYIDTSLVEAGIALSVWEAAEYFGQRVPPEPLGSAHRMLAPYQAIVC